MISLVRLRKLLKYEPETGEFVWLVSRGRYLAHTKAGAKPIRGYTRIRVDGELYFAHRLAWFWMTGEWPKEIDHINRNRSDNRWANLRIATRSQNRGNASLSKNNRTGFKGVSHHKQSGKIQAHIMINRKCIFLGLFDDVQSAANAYRDAAITYFGKFANP